jgi:hypothetical protein
MELQLIAKVSAPILYAYSQYIMYIYDDVYHIYLIRKLESFGSQPTLLKRLKSNLTGR